MQTSVHLPVRCSEAAKKRGYLARHKQLRKAQAIKEAREAELLHAWPHGLPVRVSP